MTGGSTALARLLTERPVAVNSDKAAADSKSSRKITFASWREEMRSLPAVFGRSDGKDGRSAGSSSSEHGGFCSDEADAPFLNWSGDTDPQGAAPPWPPVQGQSSTASRSAGRRIHGRTAGRVRGWVFLAFVPGPPCFPEKQP